MAAFSGRELSCVRGGRQVFAGLDFTVAAGGTLFLAGANGSGKSSLLRLMAGLLAAEHGRLDWNGRPVGDDAEAHRGRLAFLAHADAVKPALNAAEDLAFWTQYRGGDAGGALDRFGLAGRADVPGRFLSAGQRRRLALARVVAARRPLWLLDEPTVGLDASARAALETALAGHAAAGGLAVIATHLPIAAPDAATLDLDRLGRAAA